MVIPKVFHSQVTTITDQDYRTTIIRQRTEKTAISSPAHPQQAPSSDRCRRSGSELDQLIKRGPAVAWHVRTWGKIG